MNKTVFALVAVAALSWASFCGAWVEPVFEPVWEEGGGKVWVEKITGMEFVWVPGGDFQMGCGDWDGDCESDEKLHRVVLDGFWMGKTEVTQGQWKIIMGNNPSRFQNGDDYPVEQVSWDDAQEFVRRLNAKNPGKKLGLPTEAQWEFACRSGGKPQKYSGGGDPDKVAWYGNNSGRQTHPVATKAPNGLGLHDMSGNVWEWVQDSYGDYSKHGKNNPIYDAGGGSDRVDRGGGWHASPSYLRCADRGGAGPGYRGAGLGFRLSGT